jgi:hypothetical protein
MAGDLAEWCKKNPAVCALIVILIIVVIWHVFLRKEKLQPFYLDQIAMSSSDPTTVKFLGRERDPLGMSLRDYYVENTMNANNTIAPFFNQDGMYANHTKYLSMPRMYRPPPNYKPRPLAALIDQDGNVTNSSAATAEAAPEPVGDVVPTKAVERMNQKNKNTRNRFFA